MKCLQCSAELLDSATFCARCGAPVRTTSFSYLSAGTPAWPTSPPSNFSYSAMSDEATDAALARKIPRAKPKRSASQILVIISAFLLTIVIGVGGTLGVLALNGQFSPAPTRVIHLPTVLPTNPAATPTPTQQGNVLPTPNSFLITTNKAIGVSLKYPGDWIQDPPQVSTSGTSVSFHPQQSLGINLSVERFSDSASAQIASADEINKGTLQSLSTDSTLHNYKEVPPANATPTLAGVKWLERDATFANANGDAFHAVSIAVKHGNAYYSIFYFAPATVFNEAMLKYYSQMLSSFQFTS